jgi:hypothetical protein
MAKKDLEVGRLTADWIGANLFEAHRGIIRCGDLLVAFGNDCYQTETGESSHGHREVEHFREWLVVHGCTELDFGVSEGGYTWRMVLKPPAGSAVEPVEQALWACWGKAKGSDESNPSTQYFNHLQQGIARRVLDRL